MLPEAVILSPDFLKVYCAEVMTPIIYLLRKSYVTNVIIFIVVRQFADRLMH